MQVLLQIFQCAIESAPGGAGGRRRRVVTGQTAQFTKFSASLVVVRHHTRDRLRYAAKHRRQYRWLAPIQLSYIRKQDRLFTNKVVRQLSADHGENLGDLEISG